MNWLEWLFAAQLTIGGSHILWREIVGNAFGFASAIGGMRRRVWAWPVGIVGNVLLFTVFFGVAFSSPAAADPLRPGRPAGLLHPDQRLRLVAVERAPQGPRR